MEQMKNIGNRSESSQELGPLTEAEVEELEYLADKSLKAQIRKLWGNTKFSDGEKDRLNSLTQKQQEYQQQEVKKSMPPQLKKLTELRMKNNNERLIGRELLEFQKFGALEDKGLLDIVPISPEEKIHPSQQQEFERLQILQSEGKLTKEEEGELNGLRADSIYPSQKRLTDLRKEQNNKRLSEAEREELNKLQKLSDIGLIGAVKPSQEIKIHPSQQQEFERLQTLHSEGKLTEEEEGELNGLRADSIYPSQKMLSGLRIRHGRNELTDADELKELLNFEALDRRGLVGIVDPIKD